MKKNLKIVGKKPEARSIGSGRLRRDVLGFLDSDLGLDMSDLPPSIEPLISVMEGRYTPRVPSIRDQVNFMIALGSLVSATPPADAPKTVNEAMHYLADPLGLIFHEEPELKFWPDSPNAGDRMCICSYCEEVIYKAPVMRFFDRENNTEARLHLQCFEVCQEFGLIPENIQGIE